MNLNQAKAALGIARNETIAGRESLEQVVKRGKTLAVKYHPDRNPNNKAAEQKFIQIMAACDFFKKLIPKACPVCGVTISRGATHCQIHQRSTAKALPAAAGWQPQAQRKGNGNARVDVSPKGGLIARFGFYLSPVKKVFKKWQRTLGEDRTRDIFIAAADGILHHRQVSLALLPRTQGQCALEFKAALASVVCDRTKMESWLIRLPIQVAAGENGFTRWDSIETIAAKIAAGGGRNKKGEKFSTASIRKALDRLQLTTPKEKAKSFRRVVKVK
jgi:DnaJ domain